MKYTFLNGKVRLILFDESIIKMQYCCRNKDDYDKDNPNTVGFFLLLYISSIYKLLKKFTGQTYFFLFLILNYSCQNYFILMKILVLRF